MYLKGAAQIAYSYIVQQSISVSLRMLSPFPSCSALLYLHSRRVFYGMFSGSSRDL